jgi:hypothetical protein
MSMRELRLDYLLSKLRDNASAILEAIDRDPLLLKRSSGPLVLANASQALYTPQHEHQLFAKGIVYRRDPYHVVSLPLIKIFNLGERDVTIADLAALRNEPNVRLHFLRKIDGSLIQVFRYDGRTWFTTRGMIEGANPRLGCDNGEDASEFDYIGTARRIATERYPQLLDNAEWLDGRTLIFELIHPLAKKVTDYGERSDLILLGCWHVRRLNYATYPEAAAIAAEHGLTIVDALSPRGATLAEQIDDLLASLAGTDQEGCVLQFENAQEVIYRAKVKSPDYLRLMRAMAECTYESLAALLEENPHLKSWQDVEAFLHARGREAVPEEVLLFYRLHFERFAAYLADCERLCQWARQVCDTIDRQLGGRQGQDTAAYRKRFAALATRYRHAPLLFAALDGRLNRQRLRRLFRDPQQVRQALSDLGLT